MSIFVRARSAHSRPARQVRLAAPVAAVAALMLTAGCAAAGGSTGGSSSSGGSGSSGVVSEMQALLDKYSQRPQFQAPGPTLDASKLKGKTVAIVAIDLRVPALAEVAGDVKSVARELGITTTVFDGQSNPTQVNQGMTQAINSHAGAILSLGLPVQIISGEIKAAKDAGIPVIDVINTPPVANVPGQGSDPNVFGNVAPDSKLVGQLLAATAITDTKGEAHVAIMNTSELTVAPTLVGSMEQTLKECSGCDYTTTDTALNDWATQLPDQAASLVRSHPNVNFVLPIYDGMSLFATTGVRQAGATGKVKMASFNGTAAALKLVQGGDIMMADVAQNNDWAAWAAMDQAMRGMLGMSPANPVLPIRYVNTKDVHGVDTGSQDKVNTALFGTGYQDGYRQLWGLS